MGEMQDNRRCCKHGKGKCVKAVKALADKLLGMQVSAIYTEVRNGEEVLVVGMTEEIPEFFGGYRVVREKCDPFVAEGD